MKALLKFIICSPLIAFFIGYGLIFFSLISIIMLCALPFMIALSIVNGDDWVETVISVKDFVIDASFGMFIMFLREEIFD
jgi:hypothetical protein